jgi:hypothetical protein
VIVFFIHFDDIPREAAGAERKKVSEGGSVISDLDLICHCQAENSIQVTPLIVSMIVKGVPLQMSAEQEQQLQSLDVDIQIAEKQLRIAAIKKQIAEIELDILGLHQELSQRMNQDLEIVAA